MTTQTVPTARPASTAGFPTDALTEEERDSALTALMTDGITARRGAFSREFIAQMAEDVEAAFEEARSRPDGAVGRGPNRYYVEIHPEQLRGFVDLVDHPWVRRVCTGGARRGLRDRRTGVRRPVRRRRQPALAPRLPRPRGDKRERRLTSLAFNLTAVDTEEDMGPFEIAPGTQCDNGAEFEHEMFPDRSIYARYEELAVRKYPRRVTSRPARRSPSTAARATTRRRRGPCSCWASTPPAPTTPSTTTRP